MDIRLNNFLLKSALTEEINDINIIKKNLKNFIYGY